MEARRQNFQTDLELSPPSGIGGENVTCYKPGVKPVTKGPFGFEGYINTGIDILNFNSRVFEYQYLDTRRP
jgi:hypothetical protein